MPAKKITRETEMSKKEQLEQLEQELKGTRQLLKRVNTQNDLDFEINGSTKWPNELIKNIKEAIKQGEES